MPRGEPLDSAQPHKDSSATSRVFIPWFDQHDTVRVDMTSEWDLNFNRAVIFLSEAGFFRRGISPLSGWPLQMMTGPLNFSTEILGSVLYDIALFKWPYVIPPPKKKCLRQTSVSKVLLWSFSFLLFLKRSQEVPNHVCVGMGSVWKASKNSELRAAWEWIIINVDYLSQSKIGMNCLCKQLQYVLWRLSFPFWQTVWNSIVFANSSPEILGLISQLLKSRFPYRLNHLNRQTCST